MGFWFRKSLKLGGGFRLNLGSGGLGISGGMKGLRVSANTKRGLQANAGIGGFRFQKNLNMNSKNTSKSQTKTHTQVTSTVPGYTVKVPSDFWIFKGIAYFFLIYLVSAIIFMRAGVSNLHLVLLGSIVIAFVVAYRGRFSQTKAGKAYALYKEAIAEPNESKRLGMLEAACRDLNELGLKSMLAQIFWEKENYEKALPYFLQVVDDPRVGNTPTVVSIIGHCLLRTKSYKEAISYFDKVDEADEFDGFMSVLALKTECYFELKEYDRALAIIKTGLAKRSEEYIDDKRNLRVWQSRIYMAMGDKKRAITELKTLLKEVPGYETAKSLLLEIDPTSEVS